MYAFGDGSLSSKVVVVNENVVSDSRVVELVSWSSIVLFAFEDDWLATTVVDV